MKTHWEICSRCHGDGVQIHPAFRVITQEDLERDPSLLEDVRNGTLPKLTCKMCGGSGKVLVDNETGNSPQEESYEERYEEARLRAAENGDWEAYNNPEYLM